MTDCFSVFNANIVTKSRNFIGSMQVENGVIQAIDEGSSSKANAQNWAGDYLLPGFVELHTDNLERHLMPRPKVSWPAFQALLSHDAEIAASGITTVFDALGVGDVDESALRGMNMSGLLNCIDEAENAGVLRAEHKLHVRCELPAPNVVELFSPFIDNPRVSVLSLMDHTPGQRQWTNVDHARTYYTGKKGWSHEKFDQISLHSKELQQQYAEPHRRFFVDYAKSRKITLASHDDTTPIHVDEAVCSGVTLSEFPTTVVAAEAAREQHLHIIMGAPNVVRGGSHSGNVSAIELAKHHWLDILSSDYVPSSLLDAAFTLKKRAGYSLSQAIATISINPARAVGLMDRGELALQKKADFSRVRLINDKPCVISVWRDGKRVI